MNRQRLLYLCAGIGVGAALVAVTRRDSERQRRIADDAADRAKSDLRPRRSRATVTAARRLNRAAGLLATSVLLDSGVEHYRGSFKNKAMFTPLIVSTLTLGTSLHGTADMRPVAHRTRDVTYALAAATGLVGTGFHFYNVGKKLGGFCWQNLFYAAPLGAPMAILLSGLVGFASERVRDSRPEQNGRPEIFTLPAGRMLAAVISLGLLGTTAEAGLLHFRGAYHNPAMLLPVTLPPVGALLMAAVALGPRTEHAAARIWMWLLVVMGFAGAGFHAYGVSRNMGGFTNWSQNILNGPPLPAPPSFSGLAIAGLACLDLVREHPDA